ncbi:DUF2974 domain-containing protein [Bifidobacterium choerinum]|uniref:DUF2974 domain-containing protein n=1 Tax=Bifidobacterium choerinum TaxID=35760 RepID=UPI003F8E2932
MGNILDYAHTETRDFSEWPFHVADALVFALLSYDKIPDDVPTLATLEQRYGSFGRRVRSFDWHRLAHSFRALARAPFDGPALRRIEHELGAYEVDHPYIAKHSGFGDPRVSHEFYRSIAANPRFSVVHVSAAEERFDEAAQTQFAALTFRLPTGELVIAFRGTDDSLVGWKEDFNMAYRYPVPAQKHAADYLEQVAALWDGDIILTGHSKGGNVSVYAAMNAHDDVKDRIRHIYSFDGPGFPPDVVRSYEYGTIVDRITKVVPDSSIIGMLLNESPRERLVVVKSDADGLGQHSCYSWQMRGDDFEIAPGGLSDSSKTFNDALNDWLGGMTQRQREHGVEALFRVLMSSGYKSTTELMKAGPRVIPGMLGQYVGLTSEERKYINQALWMLATATFRH